MPAKPVPKIEAMAAAVAAGTTVIEWARAHGVKERTARNWAAEPLFKARVAEIRRAVLDEAIGKLSALATKACGRLGMLLDSESEHIQIAAVRTIFSTLIEARNQFELVERVNELEARLDGSQRPPEPPGIFDAARPEGVGMG